jgi:hypothetical protein
MSLPDPDLGRRRARARIQRVVFALCGLWIVVLATACNALWEKLHG